jgi:hypothetical protein
VFPCVDKKTENSLFAKGFAGFQPVQALNQDERSTVGPHQDRRLLALVEHAHRYFINALLFEGRAPFDWHVEVSDREGFRFHHGRITPSLSHESGNRSHTFPPQKAVGHDS